MQTLALAGPVRVAGAVDALAVRLLMTMAKAALATGARRSARSAARPSTRGARYGRSPLRPLGGSTLHSLRSLRALAAPPARRLDPPLAALATGARRRVPIERRRSPGSRTERG